MEYRLVNRSEWLAFTKSCEQSNFFQTPYWYEIWEKYENCNIGAYLIDIDGNEILFPFCYRKRIFGLFNEYFSGPLGTYGGFLQQNLQNIDQVKINRFIKNFRLLQIRYSPINMGISESIYTDKSITHLIDLSFGWERILSNWSKGHKSAISSASALGIEISNLKNKKQLEEYHQLYVSATKNWDNPGSILSKQLFELIDQLPSEYRKFWLAYREGKLIAGAICFYYNKHVIYWHSAMDHESRNSNVGQYLQSIIIQDAINNNYEWYDFNPSGPHDGVAKFKKGFGAVEYAANIYTSRSLLRNILNFRSSFIK